ncbi:MAG: cysteine--tRNA ligase [Desulfobulbus sp.]|nr:MAG: cysteine--tRNA ligase [Desulfobulbus sp.]
MKIKIYNTLARKKEVLHPLEEGHVKLYVCGITSYDYCHIGHARSALVFDMVVRYLRYRGYRVTFVRNFTDIDDKIIARAAEQGVDAQELAQRFIDEFYVDMDALAVMRPDIEPRATDHIPEMIELVQELIDKGLAYPSGGDVYYRVNRFTGYGALSGRSLEDMQAGARIEVNDQKEHPMDFVLWKAAKPGEPKWQSPWGDGRPGWHIECSAMSRKYFGETFDIHGGGKDLIFPHHENEIAQSSGASGKTFANLWMHHGFVTIKDEKMSKSLGNFLTIRDVLEQYPAEVLRLFIFSTQYRNPLDFTEDALQDAQSGLDRMYDCLAGVERLSEEEGEAAAISSKDRKKIASLRQRFESAMDNDFNTAQALGFIFDTVKVLNKLTRMLSQHAAAEDILLVRQGAADVRELAGVLGVLQQEPVQYVARKKQQLLDSIDISEDKILELIARRNAARDEKDWAASDLVRDELLAHNVELHDGPEGTTWDVKS